MQEYKKKQQLLLKLGFVANKGSTVLLKQIRNKQLKKMVLATATDKPFKVVIYTWGHIFNKQ